MTLVLSALPVVLPHWKGVVLTHLMCVAIWHVVGQMKDPYNDE